MESEFDERIDRRGTGSLKWDIYQGRDVLPFWVADMDFRSPPEVLASLRRQVEHGVFGYGQAGPGVTGAVLDYFRRAHGVELEPSWIVWLPGLVPALSAACRASGRPGDAVLTVKPVYPPFLRAPGDAGMDCLDVPLRLDREAGEWRFDWAGMEEAVRRHGRARLFLFCHPHNPVGKVWREEELNAVEGFCREHDLWICSDEIHCDLVLDPERTPHRTLAARISSLGDRLIVLMAASKTYNVAGLGCAFAVIPDAGVRKAFRRASGGWLAPPTVMGLAATEAAYRWGDPWRQRLLAYLEGNRREVEACVREVAPGMASGPVEATYLAWLDGAPLGTDDPAAFLLRHGLGVSNGADFGAPGWFRFNFGCPRSLVREGLERLRAAVSALA